MRQKSITKLVRSFTSGETTTSISKRSHSQKILPGVEVRGIVKVSRLEENDPLREKYWTETIDISAKNEHGRKLFQSVHVIAVPEGQTEDFKILRKQMRESLLFEFQRIHEELGRS